MNLNTINRGSLVIMCMLISSWYTHAKIGCMDNSKHTHIQDGFDYKTLHFVTCSCPCNKMRSLARKHKCFKCGHYSKANEADINMNFLKETANQGSLHLPLSDRFM